ncbi:MAG: hypothetical protein ACYTFI_11325 [Planctomycetota bacterium]|jgi:hypothetical protein
MANSLRAEEIVKGIVATQPEPIGHGGWYSEEGDCYFFHAENTPYHAVRLGPLVTVYEADEDDRPVGLQIKGIRTKLARATEFGLALAKFIADGEEMRLSYLVGFAMRISRPASPPDLDHLFRTVERSSRWSLSAEELQKAAAL